MGTKAGRAIGALVAGLALVIAGASSASASEESDDIRDLTNAHRASHDAVAPLKCSPSLDAVALAWANQMAATDTLYHNPNLRYQVPAGWTGLAENVAYNKGYPEPVSHLVTQWIDSPGHHTNMSKASYTHMGSAYLLDGNGKSWGVQVFGTYAGSPDPTLTTVTGTFVDSALNPLAGTAIVASTSAGSATAYVGTNGTYCVAVPPGAGTVTLSIGGSPITQLSGASAGSSLNTYYVAPSSTPPTPGTGLVVIDPSRIADLKGLTPSVPACFAVRGRAGVPNNASGIIVNVTASQARGPGNAVVYPDSWGTGTTPSPNASTVNFETGKDVANSAFVALGSNGSACVEIRGSSVERLILDVSGYVTPEAGVTLTNSTRLLDTRPGVYHVGPIASSLTAFAFYPVKVTGSAGVPEGATAIIANVTVTNTSGVGHLRAWARNVPMPNTSVLNYAPGNDKANGQIIGLSPQGEIELISYGANTDLIIDVTGYLTASSTVVPVTPTRIVETRSEYGRIGPSAGALENQRVYSAAVGSTVPSNATAVILNVTAVQPQGAGHLRVYPDSWGNGATPAPNVSTLNYIQGRDIPNSTVVKLSPSRAAQLYSVAARTDLVVDLVGYVVPVGSR